MNAAAMKAKNAEWERANADLRRAARERWNKANPEKVRDGHAAWRRAHPLETASYVLRRRALLRAGQVGVTVRDLRAIRAASDGLCAYCLRRAKLTFDHVTPLSRGGAHAVENLVMACGSCNSAKGARGVLFMLNRLSDGSAY